MISEKLDFKFDIKRLQEHFLNNVLGREITRQSDVFGGWSVLSSNGDYKDGWQPGHLLLDKKVSDSSKKAIQNIMPKSFSEYTVETEICSGYLKEIIDITREKKLSPYRARITCLTAGKASSWHIDAPPGRYAVRLHIPILTNDKCFFESRTESEHLLADGSAYLIYVNREHRVGNWGTTDRYHLIMDVRDTHQVSRFHRFEDFKISHGT
jgi:hypothetical protein